MFASREELFKGQSLIATKHVISQMLSLSPGICCCSVINTLHIFLHTSYILITPGIKPLATALKRALPRTLLTWVESVQVLAGKINGKNESAV